MILFAAYVWARCQFQERCTSHATPLLNTLAEFSLAGTRQRFIPSSQTRRVVEIGFYC